jgi:DNA-binding LacI/PurR family transcriptional regulator
MAEMEYQPSRHAQALSTGRSRLLGVIPYNARNLYRTFMGQRILEGFATVSFSQGYHFVIFEELAQLTPERKTQLRKAVVTNEIDGLVVLTVDYPDEDLGEPLRELAGDAPLLTIGTSDEQVGDVRLSIHLEDASRQVLDHFRGLGHENIGLAFHPETEGTIPVVEAFKETCEEQGCPISEDCLFVVDRYKTDQSHVVESMRESGVTAVFCVFDLIAMKMTFALKKEGVQIPADISLVGFGDYLTTPHIDPPLTTFAPPMRQLGELSADYLIARVENPEFLDQPVRQRLRGELLIRGSTAPPPGRTR